MPRYRVTIDYGKREEFVVEADSEEAAEALFHGTPSLDPNYPEPVYVSEDILNFEVQLEDE